jgi:DUF1680 family protein
MRKLFRAVVVAVSALAVHADTLIKDQAKVVVAPKVTKKAWAFDLTRVRLLDGPFKRAMEADARYMLSVDVDRLLSRYRQYSGLPSKGPEYTGWESATISGHTLGHFLSAAAMMYASTGDKRFLEKVNYIVDEVALAQQTKGTGFVGGFPKQDQLWKEIAGGIIRTQAFDLNGVWVPWYTTHKLMGGLVDAYLVAGNAKAKDVLVKLADWTIQLTDSLTDEQMQQMMATEQGGVLESYTDIFAHHGRCEVLEAGPALVSQAFYGPSRRGPRQSDRAAHQHQYSEGARRSARVRGHRRPQMADHRRHVFRQGRAGALVCDGRGRR